MQEDRRKFNRFEIPLTVELKHPGTGKVLLGVTKDFSRTGMCVDSQRADYSVQEILELSIEHPKKKENVDVSGKVMWLKETDKGRRIGIEMIDIDKEAKGEILDHAYDLWVEDQRSANHDLNK